MQVGMSLSLSLKKVLTVDENIILATKYSGKLFSKMFDTELLQTCTLLVVKISIITGWSVPAGEVKNILVDQFCKKIIESYSNTNVNEVEYAFRNRPIEIKDWGKDFNLTLFDEVMSAYLLKRFELSKFEEQKKETLQKLYTDEEILNQRRGEIETFFQNIKKGRLPILHVYFKEVLEMDGLLLEGENVYQFFVRKLNSMADNIYTK